MSTSLPHKLRKPKAPAIIAGTLCACMTAPIAYEALFNLHQLSAWYQNRVYDLALPWVIGDLANTASYTLSQRVFLNLPNVSGVPGALLDRLQELHLVLPLLLRFGFMGGTIAGAVYCAGRYVHKRQEAQDGFTHIRGRQLLKGKKAIKAASKAQSESIKTSGKGICIAPKVPVSLETESKHMLLVGASGGGKTQIMKSWISQLLRSRDKMIIHDTKGDVTASFPDHNFILLAPHDKRTWAWDIAADCQGPAAARELAARLIPEGKDPTWSNGARQILTGLIIWLQRQEHWSWNDLRDIAFADPQRVRTILDSAYPEGARYIEIEDTTGAPNKTSYSFLVSMWSSVGALVCPLAEAWGNTPADRQVSLREWLSDEHTQHRTLIFQRSAQFRELSEVWIGAAVQLMANFAASAEFGESRSRRIWLMLDEFAQLGKLKGFQQFLEVGRSRGIRCALGMQDLEQLSELYGKEALGTWLNTIETKIICKMNAGPSAKKISQDLIGEREVSWTEQTKTHTPGNIFDNRQSTESTNTQYRTNTIPVILPSQLEDDLGLQSVDGVLKIKALMLSSGGLYQLNWPLTHWPELRPASQPADWVQG